MSQGGKLLGSCRHCGSDIFAGKRFCGGCGSMITSDLLTLVFPSNQGQSAPVPPVKTVTAPRGLRNPTQEQIKAARLSMTNPYANWGTLVCDDSNQKMWREEQEEGTVGKYAGNAFCVSDNGFSSWMICERDNHLFSDFAYQAHIKVSGVAFYGNISLIFRSDRAYDVYYRFMVTGGSAGLLLGRQMALIAGFDEYQSIDRNGGVLMAVVAQGEIIDLYANLVHIGRIEDYSISSGEVGLLAEKTDVLVTHAKVWRK